MKIIPSYSLLEHNTFRVEAKSSWWIAYEGVDDLEKLARDEYFKTLPFIHLGLGANTLFVGDYEGAVLHSQISSIELSEEEASSCLCRAGSGVVWDELVAQTVERGFYGLENLSGIPATVGAAIVQNIGAYGSEVGQFVEEIEVFDLSRGELFKLKSEEAQFGYRHSIFKTPDFERMVITHVTLRLSRTSHPNLSYHALAEAFSGKASPTPAEVRSQVLAIRQSKLPDVDEFPNAGSFFKNPVIAQDCFNALQSRFPSIPHWPSTSGDDRVKISAAWLIDQAGFKGKRVENVGCYPLQPLVIVNYGATSGAEIVQFAERVKVAVSQQFGIVLEPEVRFVGSLKEKDSSLC